MKYIRAVSLVVFLFATAISPLNVKAQSVNIAAVVNDEIISSLDVEQRTLLGLATTGLEDTQQIRARMRNQVIRSLVDETLQIQEAKRQNIQVKEDEVKAALAGINQQRQLPSGSFERFLQMHNVPMATVDHQLRAQIAWSKVIGKSLRGKVRVSDEEVNRERERVATGQDINEYNISSILLPVAKAEEEANVKAQMEEITGQLNKGESFLMLARQYSAGNADTVAKNQNVWVQLHQLEPMLAKAVGKLHRGEISPPLRTQAGYQILKLNDERTANTAEMADSEVLLKQITMRLKPTAEQKEAEVLLDIAGEVAKHPGSCQSNDVAGMGDLQDLEFDIKFERANFREVQPQLQNMLAPLRVGDVTEPYATPAGIHLVMLCERVDKPVELPSAELVREKLYRQKLELEAAKLLRNLRREAFVETRQ